MFRASFVVRKLQPLPPRMLKPESLSSISEPYFTQFTFQWSDPILEKVSEYIARSVGLQKKIMLKAGVSDVRECNQVEIEMRLGQIATRKIMENKPQGGSTHEKSGGMNHKAGHQRRHAESLMRLPVASPAIIDEHVSSFISGFKVLGRCDAFFTVPVRVSAESSHFVEKPNVLTDSRIYELEIGRKTTAIHRKSLLDDGDEESAELQVAPHCDLSILSRHQRIQSAVVSEEHLSESQKGASGPQDGSVNSITLGQFDASGSDGLPSTPRSWVRATKQISPEDTESAKPAIFSAEGDCTRFEIQAHTSDGYRLVLTDGALVTTGNRVEDGASRDTGMRKVSLDAMDVMKQRREAIADFVRGLTPACARSALQLSTDGVRDLAVGADLPSYHSKATPQYIAFAKSHLMRKTNVAQCNFRMPQWSADARLSVSVERTANDDKTPFDVEKQKLFSTTLERTYAESAVEEASSEDEKKRIYERVTRDITLIRLSKRCEYRLAEFDFGIKTSRSYRIANVCRWFKLNPIHCTVGSCVVDKLGCRDRQVMREAVMRQDIIADNFLKLYVTDVYNSTDPGVARGSKPELLLYADMRRVFELNVLLVKPSLEDGRSREVEVEVNMPALMDAIRARERMTADTIANLEKDNSLSETERLSKISAARDEEAFQISELFAVIGMRMLEAHGSFARLP